MKKSILYVLLVLGLAALGVGGWLLYDAMTEDAIEGNPVTIHIPDGEPVIYEKVQYLMQGRNYELYIYGDGSAVYIREEGLRFRIPGHSATRTWNTGNVTAAQVDSLLHYLKNSGLDEMDDYYQFPGEPLADGGMSMSDMSYTLIVNSDNLSKMVSASGYLTPDNEATYPDMPSPLNEIYERLRTLVTMTEEVHSEPIND